MAWRAFALDALPEEPWRNGGGRTRTIASQRLQAVPHVSSAAHASPWDWRLSVATIERSGPFSAFPGVDRSSLLLGPGRIELSTAGETTLRLLHTGDAVDYRGDAGWQATVQRDGPPLLLLNVMTRRGVANALLHAARDDISLSGQVIAVFAIEGRWRVVDTSPDSDDAQMLTAGQGAVSDPPSPSSQLMRCRIERLSGAGWLAAVTIHEAMHGSR